MKKNLTFSSVAIFLLFVAYSCQKEQIKASGETKPEQMNSITTEGDLEATAPVDCGQFKTQSPGGWGAPPNGDNPGKYLHDNFAGAFPLGLTIGCYPGTSYVRFSSAQAITDYLPAGGKPSSLTNNYINPGSNQLKNTFVNHVIALTLSTRFDVYDANFAGAEMNLGQMVIGSGIFAGWNVDQLLAEAHKVLGGCGGTYSVSDLTEALDQINNNFTDGSANNGFLVCPNER